MVRWGRWERRPAADLTPMAAAAAAVVSTPPPQHQDTLSWRSKERHVDPEGACNPLPLGTSDFVAKN
jgi:hypothetical protein